jgi:predicted DsbA family dithiol-disulfide isomerase
MTGLTFFFDPVCPWAWRTSLWIRDVQRQRELDVRWRFFSLAIINNYAAERPYMLAPLRALALVERIGGNEAVDRAYLAMGTALHERGESIRKEGAVERIIPAALSEAGFDASLYQRALDDPSTLEAVEADHTVATEQYAAFGVPWLVLDGQKFGFYGPIIQPVPQGDEVLALWEHTSWMLSRPYLYELKRER